MAKKERNIDKLAAEVAEAMSLIMATSEELDEIVKRMNSTLEKMKQEKDDLINSPHVASVLHLIDVKDFPVK